MGSKEGEIDLLQVLEEPPPLANTAAIGSTPNSTPPRYKDKTPPEVPSKPKSKIIIYADIPSSGIKHRELKILPSCNVIECLEKLRQKKLLANGRWMVKLIPRQNPMDTRSLSDPSQSLWESHVCSHDTLVVEPEMGMSGDGIEIGTGTGTGAGAGTGTGSRVEFCQPSIPSHKNSLFDRMKKTLRGSATPAIIGNATNHSSQAQVQKQPEMGLLFGVELDSLAELGPPLMSENYFGVPAFMESAFDFLLREECHTEGIFRLSGSVSSIKAYHQRLDRGEKIEWVSGRDAHNATGLIKAFLREMPNPLLTFQLFEPFSEAITVIDRLTRVALVKFLVQALPITHKELLTYLCGHLKQLCEFESETKMGISNIATLLGPNIARPRKEPTDHQTMFGVTSKASAIASCLLSEYNDIIEEEQVDLPAFEAVAEIIGSNKIVFIENKVIKAIFEGVLEEVGVVFEDVKIVYSIKQYGTEERKQEEKRQEKEVELAEREQEKQVELTEGEQEKEVELAKGEQEKEIQLTEGEQEKEIQLDEKKEFQPEKRDNQSSSTNFTLDVKDIQDSIKNTAMTSIKITPTDFTQLLTDRLRELEGSINELRLNLDEERRERQQLAQLIPQLMKNQDEMLNLLNSFNQT